ncbi:MAG TPA: alpha/beta fold hydrolase [Arenimonas sp.]|nr:alpha/beta fold hydrolase [Arenimonas sp.]
MPMRRGGMVVLMGGKPIRRFRRWRILLWTILTLAALLGLPWLLANPEPLRLDATARTAAPGQFLELSAGTTHYRLEGPARGRLVVLVHGTTVPSLVWRHNVPALTGAGYRVLSYDLYGRGYSDRPSRRHDLGLYVGQLEELVNEVARGEPVDLVGLSIGAVVAAEYARRYPGAVRHLVLISPAGMETAPPLGERVGQWPLVGEYLLEVAGTRLLRPSRNMLHAPGQHAGLDADYLKTIRFRGSRAALLDSLRRLPYAHYGDRYRELRRFGVPVLLVWGRHDRIVPVAGAERLRRLVGSRELVIAEDAGHLPNYEQPATVNPALLDFLGRP